MSKKIYITTPIYYGNGHPHLGHAYTTILADLFKRYKQLFGYEAFLTTGMDEHGQKIAEKALSLHLSPQELVDRNAAVFRELWQKLDISYDAFIRTSAPEHSQTVQKIFTDFWKQGDIYLDEWTGYYCVGCEENYPENRLVKNTNGELFCQVGHLVNLKREQSYFFRMKQMAGWLKQYYDSHPDFIIPNHRINELKNNFLHDLEDLSISRTSFQWGIPVQENPEHVIYVWLDALFGYLTALGYPDSENYEKFWNDPDSERLHLMSKEIIRFHGIYWPIFLHRLDLNLPTHLLSHGWIITKEGKMSKSLGNIIDPFELIQRYGSDSLRFYVAKELGIYKDAVFQEDTYVDVINNNLANQIGNLVNRTLGMLHKYTNGKIPAYNGQLNEKDREFEQLIFHTVDFVYEKVNAYHLDQAVNQIMLIVDFANKYIEENKPWELFKNGEIDRLHSLLNHLSLAIYVATYLLQPVLVKSTPIIARQMNFNLHIPFTQVKYLHIVDNIQTNQPEPIFTRFNLTEK